MNIEKSVVIEAAQNYQKALQEFFQTDHVPFVHTFIRNGFSDLSESEALALKEILNATHIEVDERPFYNSQNVTAELDKSVAVTFFYEKQHGGNTHE